MKPTLYIEALPPKVSLLCPCGFFGFINVWECPVCNKKFNVDILLVSCADPSHNEEGGCSNPKCFKYKGKL